MNHELKERKDKMARKQDDEKFEPLEVKLRNGENIERMIKRFTKKVRNDGILQEYNSRRHHVKKSEKRRKNRVAASWNSQNATRN